jgi:hypothetical protein
MHPNRELSINIRVMWMVQCNGIMSFAKAYPVCMNNKDGVEMKAIPHVNLASLCSKVI